MVKKIYSVRQVKSFAKDFVRHLEDGGLRVKKAYLFGSYAKNRVRPWSDIDVCIISEKAIANAGACFLWQKRRSADIERGIEPHFFTARDFANQWNPLVQEIKKTGIELK